MKVRNGFVSNSSSSSFVISLRKLSLMQLCKILNHQVWGEKLKIPYSHSDSWDISIEKGILYCSTSMDNFDMEEFLKKIGVSSGNIVWGESGGEVAGGSDASAEDLEPCDAYCEKCQMRFICYTNRWGDKDEKIRD